MTNSEKKRLSDIVQIGCIACIVKGLGYSIPEVHHIRHGMGMGQRNTNDNAIGLCHVHHRTGGYRVALHAGQKTWESIFGTESELLRMTNKLLGNKT